MDGDTNILKWRAETFPLTEMSDTAIMEAAVYILCRAISPIGCNVYTTAVSNAMRIINELNMPRTTESFSTITRFAAKLQHAIDKDNENE
jgi:hypothetical protein